MRKWPIIHLTQKGMIMVVFNQVCNGWKIAVCKMQAILVLVLCGHVYF